MAAYIPDSYKSRDFYAGSSAYGQQWSSDDCLLSNFTTEGRKPLAQIEKELASVKKNQNGEIVKPALSQEEINKRITLIKEKRKETEKRRRERKKQARAASGATGNADQVLKLERREAELDVKWKKYVNKQVKARQEVDEALEKEYESEKELLQAQIRAAKLAPVHGAGSKSGKKKKNRVKIILTTADKSRLKGIETKHVQNLREILDKSENHQAYCQSIHNEFVEFAKAKRTFYESLPQSTGRDKKIAIVEKYHEKCENRPVDTADWDSVVFSEFKRIMQEYRAEVDEVRANFVYTSKFKSDKLKDLRKARTEAIKDLLVQNGLYVKEQASAGR